MELKIQIVEFWKTWNTNLTLKILNKPESRSPNAETLGLMPLVTVTLVFSTKLWLSADYCQCFWDHFDTTGFCLIFIFLALI